MGYLRPQVFYRDSDPPQGLVTRIEQRLQQDGARYRDGRRVELTGLYDTQLASAVDDWLQSHNVPISRAWLDAAKQVVLDCGAYRALGIQCEALFLVPGILINEARIRRFLEDGQLGLDCPLVPPPPPPQLAPPGRPLRVTAGTVLTLSGILVAGHGFRPVRGRLYP